MILGKEITVIATWRDGGRKSFIQWNATNVSSALFLSNAKQEHIQRQKDFCYWDKIFRRLTSRSSWRNQRRRFRRALLDGFTSIWLETFRANELLCGGCSPPQLSSGPLGGPKTWNGEERNRFQYSRFAFPIEFQKLESYKQSSLFSRMCVGISLCTDSKAPM